MNPNDVMLITGGTGSFGKQFLRMLIGLPRERAPGRILIMSRDEEKQFYQRHDFPDARIEYLVGNIRDAQRCMQAMDGVDIVVHAAALKQVPTGEYFPSEMIRTNVQGMENLISAAEAKGIRKFVFLSTDKAVYPINAYGMSKALAEKILQAAAGRNLAKGNGPLYMAVRYGNVMGSRGSVIPLFLKQISQGDTITVTDASMTRFLLRLSQSTSLVLYTLEHGQQGRLHVRKCPACTLDNLIKALETHFGRKLKRNIIGIRPGEKIHETLLSADELARSIEVTDEFGGGDIVAVRSYFECKMVTDPVVHDRYLDDVPVIESDLTSQDTTMLSAEQVLNLLKKDGLL